MRTQKKQSKPLRLFRKYTQKQYLTESQIKKLMKREFKLSYNQNVINSLMAIWGKPMPSGKSLASGKTPTRVITKSTFVNQLFKQPEGFFRHISL